MTYFAKWLSVEGAVLEGDRFRYKGYQMSPLKKGAGAQRVPGIENPVLKKVKLFLCSRDIQVGDKVEWDYNSEWQVQAEVSEVNGGYCRISCEGSGKIFKEVPIKELYKTIGEISPNATWVKEGDEFDEFQGLVWNNIGKTYEGGNEKNYNSRKHWPEEFPGYEIHCKVKGPCGHFH